MQSASLARVIPHTRSYFDISPQRITYLCLGYVQQVSTVRCSPLDELRGALQILNSKLTYLLVITWYDAGCGSWAVLEYGDVWSVNCGLACEPADIEGGGVYIAMVSVRDVTPVCQQNNAYSEMFLPEASFGPRVLSLPVSVCVCVSITCLSAR